MPRCVGTKRDGGRCTVIVEGEFCYQHDPARAEERRRNASRGGRSKSNRELGSIKRRLSALADDVLAGDQDRGRAAVANQILNTLIRAIEQERKIREQDEVISRLEALEQRYEQNGDKRYGFGR